MRLSRLDFFKGIFGAGLAALLPKIEQEQDTGETLLGRPVYYTNGPGINRDIILLDWEQYRTQRVPLLVSQELMDDAAFFKALFEPARLSGLI